MAQDSPQNPNQAESPPSFHPTVLEEPRGSFIAFVHRVLGGEGLSFLGSKPRDVTASAPPPTHFDRFEVIRELGRGGFGVVYLAQDPALHRQVAIKVPYDWLADDPAASARALQEARLAAKLRHPGIVAIYDISEQQGRLNYVVQEFVEGSTLHEVMTRKRLSLRHSVELLLKVAEGIQVAHAAGVYHRDLKPANLILDPQGKVHILDFGLALDEHSQNHARGQIAGTAAYMSPEQLQGDSHHIDGRTDLWSLGVIFYELLAGRKPFRGNSQETADQVLHRLPAPPRQFHSQIPKRIEACCLKCLAKPLAERFASAADLIDELREILNTEAFPESEDLSGVTIASEAEAIDTKRVNLDATKRRSAARPKKPRSRAWIIAGIALLLSAGGSTIALLSLNRSPANAAPSAESSDIDLLEVEPHRINHSRRSTDVDTYKDNRLVIHTRGECVRLFDKPIAWRNCSIHVQLTQVGPWTGEVGILYGVQPSKTTPDHYVGYLLKLYEHLGAKPRWEMEVSQVLFIKGKPGISIFNQMKVDRPLKGEANGQPSDLETVVLQIKDGQLQSVTFNGYFYSEPGLVIPGEFPELVKLAGQHSLSVEQIEGNFGVYASRTSVQVHKAIVVPQ